MSEDVRRKTAELTRQPTVWPAPPPPHDQRSRAGRVLRALPGVLALTVVPPLLLTLIFGSPADLLPSWPQVTAFVTDSERPNGTHLIVGAVAILLWLVWAIMMLLLAGSVLTVVAGWRLPRWRLPAPLHRMLFGLAGTAVVAVATTPAGTSQAPAPATAAATTGDSVLQRGTVTVMVGQTRFEYEVRRGDSLSRIARRWLGDADRWPEICQLNRHRHQTGGARLTDCDLIQPGWHLRLPADARPPAGARTTPPPRPPATRPTAPETSNELPQRDQTTRPPYRNDQHPLPAPSGPLAPEASSSSEDGIRLPSGSILTWGLATAITGAVALVWARRRRQRPQPGETVVLPAPAPPEPVDTIRRHVDRTTVPAPSVPSLPLHPVGVEGPGAEGAVRGLILAALTADHPAEILIDRNACTDLLGPASPQLRLTRDFSDTLAAVDAQLLHRSRILAEPHAHDREAMPPLLVIARAADATGEHARITLSLAHGLDITAVLLGPWPHGTTHTITADGHTSGPDDRALPRRVDVIARDDALAILAGLTPPPVTRPVETRSGETATSAVSAPVQVRVFGVPRIDGITHPGRPLRAKAAELAVYLACHPNGADSDTLVEHLHGDARQRQARQQLHTNASNLRHVLARAGGPLRGGYLLKRGTTDRYRLDPATVQVDLWQLRDLLNKARRGTPPERLDLLRQACDLYTAPLADGHDYEWIDDQRQHAHRWGIEAHLLLAETLLPDDPQAAGTILDKAMTLDPYNEDLYRTAMRARHALGDHDGVQTLLQALTTVLADIDTAPTAETVTLARTLQP
ncbi:BTAD domain-containing putative transcriptional regulator [Actinoplanes sp. NPDC026670]|uniref:BTAD domain-containing putative transcriptional regulator n=1 Tax=Actinoplanes sp. NPDC026670 TaxID=3154700 RepID=UPI0033D7FC59